MAETDPIEVLTAAKLWAPMMESLRGAFTVHDRTHQSDAALARRGDVDAVVADAEHRDDLEPRKLRDQLARHLRFAARRDRADARRDGGERGRIALVRAVMDAKRAMQRLHHRRPQARRGENVDRFGSGHGGSFVHMPT